MPAAEVSVAVIDPLDDRALRRWWDVGHAVDLERPVDLTRPWEVERLRLTSPRVGTDEVRLAASLGDEVVGAATLGLPADHNPHLAEIDLAVAAGHRRRGVGTALLGAAEQLARDRDRTTALFELRVPTTGDGGPRRAFAESRGYRLANQEVVKVVDLAATADRWPTLAAQAAEQIPPYRLLTVRGRCPDGLVDGVCAMFSRFLAEIPLGEVDLRPQSWTPGRLRAVEAARDSRRLDYLMVAAEDEHGALVGYTDLDIPRSAPRLASIHSTLVLPQARGHRLGLAMKTRLHRLTRAECSGTELIVTGNAASNTHMNAVNEALGYEPVDRILEMQKRW